MKTRPKKDPFVEAGIECIRIIDNPKSTTTQVAQAKQVFLLFIQGYVDTKIKEALADALGNRGF